MADLKLRGVSSVDVDQACHNVRHQRIFEMRGLGTDTAWDRAAFHLLQSGRPDTPVSRARMILEMMKKAGVPQIRRDRLSMLFAIEKVADEVRTLDTLAMLALPPSG